MPVCRSGRTSAWSCGTIDEVGIFVVPGRTYATDPLDLRAFTGFLSFDVQSSGGDSGGPWLSGNYAVGTHSAGEEAPRPNEAPPVNFAVAATLEDALAVLPGHQLELFLNKPTVTSPAPGETFKRRADHHRLGGRGSGVGSRSRFGGQNYGGPARSHLRSLWTRPVRGRLRLPRYPGRCVSLPKRSTGSARRGPGRLSSPPVPPATPGTQPEPDTESPAPAAVPAAGGAPASLSNSAAVVRPLADDRPANLANTGVSGLLLAAGIAAAALAVGGLLLALARRRKRHPDSEVAHPRSGRSLT